MEQDMKYIYQVYLDGSFSAAAEHLYMSQPALSIAVKRVEESVGAELFDRSRRPLALTEAGKAYIDTISRIRFLEEDLGHRLDDLRELETGSVRLGGTHYINSYILAPILGDFARRYPGVRLELAEGGSAEMKDALSRRELDAAFSCDPSVVEQFDSRPAFRDRVLLAVHQDIPIPAEAEPYILTAGDVLAGRHLSGDCPAADMAMFGGLEFILLQESNNLYDRSMQMFAEAGVIPRIRMSISQMVTAYRLAENGLGAVFVSDRVVKQARSVLRFFRIDSPIADRLFYFLLPRREYTPYAVRGFIDFAAQRLQPDINNYYSIG